MWPYDKVLVHSRAHSPLIPCWPPPLLCLAANVVGTQEQVPIPGACRQHGGRSAGGQRAPLLGNNSQACRTSAGAHAMHLSKVPRPVCWAHSAQVITCSRVAQPPTIVMIFGSTMPMPTAATVPNVRPPMVSMVMPTRAKRGKNMAAATAPADSAAPTASADAAMAMMSGPAEHSKRRDVDELAEAFCRVWL